MPKVPISKPSNVITLLLVAGSCGACYASTSTPAWLDPTPYEEPAYPFVMRKIEGLPDGSRSIAQTAQNACVLDAGGAVSCWGSNEFGHSGAPPGSPSRKIRDPVRIPQVTSLSGQGRHYCAVAADSTVFCWGANPDGRLGVPSRGGEDQRWEAVQVEGLTDAVQVSVTDGGSCALRGNGEVWCWGFSSCSYNLDLGGVLQCVQDGTEPKRVAGIDNAKEIAISETRALVLFDDGSVSSWNPGRWDTGRSASPRPVEGWLGVESIAASSSFSGADCAILESGVLECWDSVADKTANCRDTSPYKVKGLGRTNLATLGTTTGCAVAEDGVLRCWAWEDVSGFPCRFDEHGDSIEPDFVLEIPGLDVVSLSNTGAVACAVLDDGDVVCWGLRSNALLGGSIWPEDIGHLLASVLMPELRGFHSQ